MPPGIGTSGFNEREVRDAARRIDFRRGRGARGLIGHGQLGGRRSPEGSAPRRGHPGDQAGGNALESDLQAAGAQCGYLKVPLNYSDPTGPQIKLAVSRIEHTSSAKNYQGVIITNPGGPGGSGLDLNTFLIPVLQQEGFNGAADDYDWIGFDPRGVGSSIPTISCDPNYLGADRPNYVPWTPSLLATWETRSEGYASACASQNAKQTELLHNMTTVDNAKDVNSIRKALGVSQITYYGFSWGTDLGQTYASLFPKTVRRLILDSNVNMTRPGFDDFNLDQDPPFNTNEDKWFAWLAKYNDVYHLVDLRARSKRSSTTPRSRWRTTVWWRCRPRRVGRRVPGGRLLRGDLGRGGPGVLRLHQQQQHPGARGPLRLR